MYNLTAYTKWACILQVYSQIVCYFLFVPVWLLSIVLCQQLNCFCFVKNEGQFIADNGCELYPRLLKKSTALWLTASHTPRPSVLHASCAVCGLCCVRPSVLYASYAVCGLCCVRSVLCAAFCAVCVLCRVWPVLLPLCMHRPGTTLRTR